MMVFYFVVHHHVLVKQTEHGVEQLQRANVSVLTKTSDHLLYQWINGWIFFSPETFTISFVIAAVDCGQLTAPVNGTRFGTKTFFPNSMTFSCDEGFDLIGSSRRTCQSNGTWSGSSTTCKG